MSENLIPIRMLVQFAYCNRLSYMEWVQGEFESNYYVVDGKYKHRNVDRKSGTKKMQEDSDETIHASSVTLSDPKLGIIGKIDRMEKTGNVATPIEYKRGKVPDTPNRWYESNMVQVCAQALLLEANGYTSKEGIIYYVDSKERVHVEFTPEMVDITLGCIKGIKEMAKGGVIPPPLVDSPKCPKCSLVGICLPDETHLLADSGQRISRDSVRRMYPARADSRPVYVQEQGARIGKSGETVKITTKDGNVTDVRLMDVSEVNLYGNVPGDNTGHTGSVRARNTCLLPHVRGMVYRNDHRKRKQERGSSDPTVPEAPRKDGIACHCKGDGACKDQKLHHDVAQKPQVGAVVSRQ